jgi:hypothetical protein
MSAHQCGLCLSCGVPFFPDVENVQFFNRQGNLSVVFLNTEYVNNPDIRRLYTTPRFATEIDRAHMFHQSHHAAAIQYMCSRHRDDADVGGALGVNQVVPDQRNAPLLYYHAPTSQIMRGAEAACWGRPNRRQRLNMRPLLGAVMRAADPTNGNMRPVAQNLDLMYSTCKGCNSIMTQQANFKYLLGCGVAGRSNPHGGIIENQPITQYSMNQHRQPLENAYGHWTRAANPPPVVHPDMTASDSVTPHVAYYLHLCLPFKRQGQAHDAFRTNIASQQVRRSAKTLYVEQCWLILEIAALATLLEEGHVTRANPMLAHGRHQHYGVLDLYVSFFLWRLIEFEHGGALQNFGLDFVQWHQKYYWEAMNCKHLFRPNQRHGILGQHMYGTTAVSARTLVVQICRQLMRHYNGKLRPLIQFLIRAPNVPPDVEDFFVQPRVLRELRNLSAQACANFFFRVLMQGLRFIFIDRPLRGTSRRRWACSGSTLCSSGSPGCARTTRGRSAISSSTSG